MEKLPKMSGLDTRNISEYEEKICFSIREALPEDVIDVLNWRNDPYVCAVSRHRERIDETAHRTWYSQALHDPGRLLFIGLLEGRKIGIVRFDLRGKTLWEVSITLSHEARGHGLGKLFLEMALERLLAAHAASDVVAEVLSTNKPSLQLFQSAGFIPECQNGGLVRFQLHC